MPAKRTNFKQKTSSTYTNIKKPNSNKNNFEITLFPEINLQYNDITNIHVQKNEIIINNESK